MSIGEADISLDKAVDSVYNEIIKNKEDIIEVDEVSHSYKEDILKVLEVYAQIYYLKSYIGDEIKNK